MRTFSPDFCHTDILKQPSPSLSFNPNGNYEEWRRLVKSKLTELLGDMPEKVSPKLQLEYEKKHDAYIEKRFVFQTEQDTFIPCHLLLPNKGEKPFPIVICLQGHTTGMHISLGRAKDSGDESLISGGDRDFALQAVAQGYAALVMEQRCFGERKSTIAPKTGCHHSSMAALLIGRTMIGERVWDISRAIDILHEFPELDTSKLACMGNSGGGTATFYAACMDERIQITMPSCSLCTFADSIGTQYHCMCNYIPGIFKYFDMGDLACLIAPRPLVIVAGKEDPIFPLDGVKKTFETIKGIYRAAGNLDGCALVLGNEGHRFYATAAWAKFKALSGWQ